MPLYENVFIARQDLSPDDLDTLVDKFVKIISDGGGKIISKEYWGIRTLAYEINKNLRGHYVMLNIDSNYAAVAEMNRVMGFSEDVIRNLTFRVDTHNKESVMFASRSAKDYKPGKIINKEPSKLDLVLERVQFEA